METMVKVEHLYKEFGPETKVLKDINLTVNKNEVVAILGKFLAVVYASSNSGFSAS